MIHTLEGEIVAAFTTFTDIKVGPIVVRAHTPGPLGKPGEHVKAYTLVFLSTQTGELEVYCFRSEEEREWFKRLLSVSGIGPRTALSIIRTFPPQKLKETVAVGDVQAFSKIPGVGKRLSARIMAELSEAWAKDIRDRYGDLFEALSKLGFSKEEITRILRKLASEGKLTGNIQEDLKQALATVGKEG